MPVPTIDVLVPVRLDQPNPDDAAGFLTRFGHSIRSATAMPGSRVCVADVSRHSAHERLLKAAGVGFEYAYRTMLGSYNRSHNINFGVKALVRSEFFLISDADLIYQKGALEFLAGPADKKKCVVIPRKKQVKPLWSDDWAKADSAEGRLTSTNGSCFLAKSAFVSVRGFDEKFTGWGSEDDDFYTRLGFSGIGVMRPGFACSALAIHLHHEEHHTIDVQQRVANRRRRDSQRVLVADKKIKPWDVNQSGWGL